MVTGTIWMIDGVSDNDGNDDDDFDYVRRDEHWSLDSAIME